MMMIVHRRHPKPGMPPSSPVFPRDQQTPEAHRTVLDVRPSARSRRVTAECGRDTIQKVLVRPNVRSNTRLNQKSARKDIIQRTLYFPACAGPA